MIKNQRESKDKEDDATKSKNDREKKIGSLKCLQINNKKTSGRKITLK